MHPRYHAAPCLRRLRTAGLLLPLLLILIAGGIAHAQSDRTFVGNDYVTAGVITDRSPDNAGGGRFYISAGPIYGTVRPIDFLYQINSNVVFRVVSEGVTSYFTNAASGGRTVGRPKIGGVAGTEAVQYIAYDSIYTSADTIAVGWKNFHGYSITMRLIPERPTSGYDNGADMLLEFSYSVAPFGPPSELGIFLMLDTYNGQASNIGGWRDNTSVLTNRGYFEVNGHGRLYTAPADTLPDFYHAGNFLYQEPLATVNTLLPIHRLKGTSHNGTPLTPPNLFAIGDWLNVFRYLSWDVVKGDAELRIFEDCATVLRWDGLIGNGTVRTAFGTNNTSGNDMFHCRDSALFMDIRCPRVIEQKVKDGAYTPTQFAVEAWVTNTGKQTASNLTVTLVDPIGGPAGLGRLRVNPSTPVAQSTSLRPSETKLLRWLIDLAPGTKDTLLNIPMQFRFQYLLNNAPRNFKLPCEPVITIRAYRPPVTDTMPPLLISSGPVRRPNPTWTYAIRDRRPTYAFDTGLDSIAVAASTNFTAVIAPSRFTRCDVSTDVALTLTVVDTNRPGRVVFWARDCRGNISRDTVIYNPRPDPFRPEILRVDSAVTDGLPCNSRSFTVYLRDSINQTPTAGDLGFGEIAYIGVPTNFGPLRVNPDRGDAPIAPFDPRASFRIEVVDSTLPAAARVRVADQAGNADTIEFSYCPMPDTRAPVSVVTGASNPDPNQPAKSWSIHSSDVRAWDWGLEGIVVLSATNMLPQIPAIAPGDDAANFTVAVVDDGTSARIVLEIRDMRYAELPEGHADTVTLLYDPVPDTMSPNIAFAPVPGRNGAHVVVTVDDIHLVGTDLYKYDRGLMTIEASPRSANIRLLPGAPISFSVGAASTTFEIEVLDTLADALGDTICIAAVDLFGNRSESCYYYSIPQDLHSPLLAGGIDLDRSMLAISVSDARLYDRGLGSIELEDPVNISGQLSLGGLAGAGGATARYMVDDPERPISGTFVIRDLVGENDPSAQAQSVHTVRVPFMLPVVDVHIALPMVVEQDQQLAAAIVLRDSLPAALVRSIAFDVVYGGDASYRRGEDRGASLIVSPGGGGVLSVRCAPTRSAGGYSPGDTLGLLVFMTHGGNLIQRLALSADPASLTVNDNLESRVTVTAPGDQSASVLTLPPPFFRLAADTLTYINGVCERVLISGEMQARLRGLAILTIRPQPVAAARGGVLEIDVRDLPAEGARAELVSSDGRLVGSFDLRGSGARVTRVPVRLPGTLSSGAYFLRLRSAGDDAWAKIVIVE